MATSVPLKLYIKGRAAAIGSASAVPGKVAKRIPYKIPKAYWGKTVTVVAKSPGAGDYLPASVSHTFTLSR